MVRKRYLMLLLLVTACEPQWRIDARNRIEQQRAAATASGSGRVATPQQPTGYVVRRSGIYTGNKKFDGMLNPGGPVYTVTPNVSLEESSNETATPARHHEHLHSYGN